jgi:hypothetical protein
LLGLWVRIPPGAYMFVVIVVCFQVNVCADRLLVQRSPTVFARVLECDLEASLRGGLDPKMGRRATGKEEMYISILLLRII